MQAVVNILCRRPVLETLATMADRPQLSQRLDSRSLRVLVLLAIIIALNVFDLRYTLLAHRVGLLNEMNPIAASLFRMDLEHSVIAFKALTLLVGGFLLWRLRHSPWAPAACWLLVTVYVFLSIIWLDWSANYVQATEIETTTPMIAFSTVKAAAMASAH